MTIVTGEVSDITGRPDNTRWEFLTPVRVREGSVAGSIITDRKRVVQPLDGSIRVELDPGPATILYDGNEWEVTIPEEDSSLWDIISAAVAFPPNTSQDLLASAVDSYLQENPPSGDIEVDNISDAGTAGKAAVQATTQAQLRTAAGASTSGATVFTGTPAQGRLALGVSPEATSGAMRNLMAKLTENVGDATWLILGDSTGNATNEWVYLTTQWLAARYPAYTVNYYLWDEAGNAWPGSPTVVQTGTGSFTLSVWNASVPGSKTGYFQGSRFTTAVVKNADLVAISYGHNQGGPVDTDTTRQLQRNKYLAFADEVALANPNAGLVVVAQNPSVDGAFSHDIEWQAQRALLYAQAASFRGWGVVNVLRAFLEYGDWAADLTDPDGIHPSPAGSLLWAGVVQAALERAAKVPVTTQVSQSVAPSRQIIGNPQFTAWKGSLPDGVTSTVNCAVSKELTDYETGVQAMKVTADATDGQPYAEWSATAVALGIKGMLANRTWTVAVRIKIPAANTSVVRVYLRDNNGSGQSVYSDVDDTARDRYLWVYVTKAFASNATSVMIRVCPKTYGTALSTVTVDRIYMVPGTIPYTGSDPNTLASVPAADGDFVRKVSGAYVGHTVAEVKTALGVEKELLVGAQPSFPVGSINGNISMVSGDEVFAYFIADETRTINTMIAASGSTAAAATPTLCRYGVYSAAANGDLTEIGSTPNDTTLFAATGTEYPKALSAPVNLVEGNLYAYGLLIVSASTLPTIMAQLAIGAQNTFFRATNKRPHRSARRTGLSDLPASVLNSSLANKNGVPFILGVT